MMNVNEEYNALTSAAGFAPLGPRTQIEVTGEDRLKFLHNYCTADILRLTPNTGTEAFITSVKGKVLGHVFIYCGDESLVIETVPGQAEKLIGHLNRYTLADDVELGDATDGWAFLYVGGPQANGILASLAAVELPARTLDFAVAEIGEASVAIGRGGAISPDGFTLCCRDDDVEALTCALRDAGVASCAAEVLEILRVESGVPLYGRDVTEANLPQEANRNEQAISFTKGCYLGQETVARLDALGHVNKLLVGVKFDGDDVPEAGAELSVDGKPVGKVTSPVFSPRLNAPLALAYVGVKQSEVGSQLTSAFGDVEVIAR